MPGTACLWQPGATHTPHAGGSRTESLSSTRVLQNRPRVPARASASRINSRYGTARQAGAGTCRNADSAVTTSVVASLNRSLRTFAEVLRLGQKLRRGPSIPDARGPDLLLEVHVVDPDICHQRRPSIGSDVPLGLPVDTVDLRGKPLRVLVTPRGIDGDATLRGHATVFAGL